MILDQFPRHPLTFGPSPLQHLKRLTQHLGGAQVWAKREDVSSGLAFGGNKTRKLEYIVPDVLASGADTLVSIGGYQSNHTRQVAAVAAHLGLKVRLVQEKWVPWDEPVNDKVGNILLSRMMGADSRLDDAGFDIGIRDSWKQMLFELLGAAPQRRDVGIAAGRTGARHPVGGAAVVAAQGAVTLVEDAEGAAVAAFAFPAAVGAVQHRRVAAAVEQQHALLALGHARLDGLHQRGRQHRAARLVVHVHAAHHRQGRGADAPGHVQAQVAAAGVAICIGRPAVVPALQ